VTDELGETSTATIDITVVANAAPVAVAEADVTEGFAPLTVNFTGDNSSDAEGAVSYEWDFGTGITSTDANPSYTFSASGSYEVTLTVTDELGETNTASINITVIDNAPPVAVANANVTTGSTPLTVNFSGDGSSDPEGTISYLWNFGNGFTSTQPNPTFTFNQEGTYMVSLTVTDDLGLEDTDEIQITVGSVVVIPDDPEFELRVNAGGPALSHEGKDFVADTYFVGGKSYTNSSAQVPALYQTERSSSPKVFDYVVPVPNGTYQVTLHFAEIYWGANGGAAQAAGSRVFDVAIEGDLVLNNLNINSEVGPQTPLLETFEVEVTDGELNMNFSSLASVGGSDQPKLSAFEIIREKVNLAPVAVASASASSGTAPLTVNFTGDTSSDAEGAVSYLWNFGTGDTSTSANPSYTFTSAGNYTVSLTVTDEGGLSDTALLEIEIEEPVVVIPDDPEFELRVNAGGPALSHEGKDFVADTYFIGGQAYSNSSADVPVLFQTERSAPSKVFDYAIPLPNGSYQVILHFAEIYWGANAGGAGGTGKRTFDVSIENDLLINDLDLNAEVGSQTVLTESFTVTVADGELNMNFSSLDGVNQPKLSAFEIVGQQTEPDFSLYLNTGSAQDVSFEGKTFIGDVNLPVYYDSDHTYVNTAASDEPLYQTERGPDDGLKPLSMSIEVPNGVYTVSTYHNELFFTGGAGNRVFDILIEGELVKDDLDLFLETGNQPLKLTFENIIVNDGQLNIDFPVSANRPTISGLAIEGFNAAGSRVKASGKPMLVASPMEGEGPLMVSFSGDLLGTADPELSYFWDFGDGNASKVKNPVHTYETPGEYDVKVRVSKYGIPLHTETIPISVWDGLANKETEEVDESNFDIRMYPNPAATYVNLSIDHETERIAEVRIFDLRGRLVNIFQPADEASGRHFEVPVKNLAAGVYFVSTITETGARNLQRLIVVH
ncbi:Por secretion system C-terminal sorting domain-containing protein, partial [Cyclobacterium lianum]